MDPEFQVKLKEMETAAEQSRLAINNKQRLEEMVFEERENHARRKHQLELWRLALMVFVVVGAAVFFLSLLWTNQGAFADKMLDRLVPVLTLILGILTGSKLGDVKNLLLPSSSTPPASNK